MLAPLMFFAWTYVTQQAQNEIRFHEQERMGIRYIRPVNVSSRQLEPGCDVFEDGRVALAGSGLESHRLTLEITDTMLMRDASRSAQQLRDLTQLGLRVAIDDFGTGYCSLAYLQQFPEDALKIDRCFVLGISESTGADALIRTFVQLGKTFGIETYAEGIEDLNRLRHLQAEGCDCGEGFLFARPLAPEAAGGQQLPVR